MWHGRWMALILDHINGIANDNRLINLRLVCANCAATLDTHCGRNIPQQSKCAGCGLGSMSYCAVGRKYGVSDNAVRKWIRWYEEARKDGSDAKGGEEPMAEAA